MKAVATIPEKSPLNAAPVASAASAILAVIERAALNPEIDVEKMERLLAMQERIMERAAKAAYIAALKRVKQELPQIERNGTIVIMEKNAKEGDKPKQKTPYALFEDIDAVITPILDRHGMVVSFRTGSSSDGRIVVTGVLSHEEGHEETAMLTLPLDASGSKNNVQAIGSSISYGKRYCITSLLNLVSKGEDDDGQSAGGDGRVTEAEAAHLEMVADEVGARKDAFLKAMGVEKFTDFLARDYDNAIAALERKRAANERKRADTFRDASVDDVAGDNREMADA